MKIACILLLTTVSMLFGEKSCSEKQQETELLLRELLKSASKKESSFSGSMFTNQVFSSKGAQLFSELHNRIDFKHLPPNITLMLREKKKSSSNTEVSLYCNHVSLVSLTLTQRSNISQCADYLHQTLLRYKSNKSYLYSSDMKGNGIY